MLLCKMSCSALNAQLSRSNRTPTQNQEVPMLLEDRFCSAVNAHLGTSNCRFAQNQDVPVLLCKMSCSALNAHLSGPKCTLRGIFAEKQEAPTLLQSCDAIQDILSSSACLLQQSKLRICTNTKQQQCRRKNHPVQL